MQGGIDYWFFFVEITAWSTGGVTFSVELKEKQLNLILFQIEKYYTK